MSTYIEGIEFVIEYCCNCHIPFAMSRSFKDARLKDRKSFHCPAGHGQYYTGKSEEQKLREELERKQGLLDAERGKAILLKNERDEITKAHKRMRTRVMNGVCPCCNRTFQNLMQHMKTEHADFGELDLKTLRTAYGLTQGAVAKEIGIKPVYVSLLENKKPVPTYAKQRVDLWLEINTKVKP